MSAAAPPEPLSALRRRLAARLAAAGLGTPDLDARLIVGHATGLDLTGLVREGGRAATAAEAGAVEVLARRRLAGEPVARLLGTWAFRGLDFALSPETLVPRPDTETLVEAVLERLAPGPARIVDVGTGSGAIAVALAVARGDLTGLATDLSAGALATARANAHRHGVADRFAFVRADLAAVLAPCAFDAVVSNPPYVASGVVAGLAPEVRLHDPLAALDGGADGLALYRRLVPEAAAALRPGGLLALEIGHDQGEAVPALLAAAGFAEIAVLADLGRRARVVVGRRHAPAG